MHQLEGTRQSLIETVQFTRFVGDRCPGNSSDHGTLQISWLEPDGEREVHRKSYCTHPFCDTSGWRLSISPPQMLLANSIPKLAWEGELSIATAYILAVEDPEGRRLPELVARIGICDQWENIWGNGDGLFTTRYFGLHGPGVYPAPLEIVRYRKPPPWTL